MAGAIGNLARLSLRLSDLEIDTVHCTEMEHQAADALSRPKNRVDGKTPLYDEVPVLTISETLFACAPSTKKDHFNFIKESKGSFAIFILKVRMMAGVKENKKTEILTVPEIIS